MVIKDVLDYKGKGKFTRVDISSESYFRSVYFQHMGWNISKNVKDICATMEQYNNLSNIWFSLKNMQSGFMLDLEKAKSSTNCLKCIRVWNIMAHGTLNGLKYSRIVKNGITSKILWTSFFFGSVNKLHLSEKKW